MIKQKKLLIISEKIEEIIGKATAMEREYADLLSKVNPTYNESALNLVHYLGFRSFDIDELQDQLRYLTLPDLSNIEGHVMKSLLAIKTTINYLLGIPINENR